MRIVEAAAELTSPAGASRAPPTTAMNAKNPIRRLTRPIRAGVDDTSSPIRAGPARPQRLHGATLPKSRCRGAGSSRARRRLPALHPFLPNRRAPLRRYRGARPGAHSVREPGALPANRLGRDRAQGTWPNARRRRIAAEVERGSRASGARSVRDLRRDGTKRTDPDRRSVDRSIERRFRRWDAPRVAPSSDRAPTPPAPTPPARPPGPRTRL